MQRKKHKLDISDNLNGILFPPTTQWVTPNSFPNLSEVKLIGCDTETKDPHLIDLGPGFIRKDAKVVGISLATENKGWYFPMRHLGGGNLDPDVVVSYVKDVMKNKAKKVFANAAYDLEALWSEGINVQGEIFDVQIIEALLEEEREEGYDLNQLCKTHLGTVKDETLLKEATSAYNIPLKGGLWKLPAKYVGAYAEYDALSIVHVFKKQLERIVKEDLHTVLNLESRVTPILHQMRITGVPINVEAAEKLKHTLAIEQKKLLDEMVKEHGESINVNSGPDIAAACERKGISYLRTSTGLPSFEGKWLENHEHPFLQLIAIIRQTQKLKKDFVDKLLKQVVKGRLYSQWIQLHSDEGGTKSGRIASKNPNNQQVPASKRRNGKPNPIGAAIRALYCAEPGMRWMKADYSQQEPRILVHFAALCKMDGAEAAAFSYRANPDMDFYNFVVDAAKVNRRRAKDIYLSISYNQGLKAFAESIGAHQADAQLVLNEFNRQLPFIRQISDKCTQLADTRGYVRTLLGRRRHFNYWEPTNVYQLKKDLFAKGLAVSSVMDYIRPRPLALAHKQWPNDRLKRAWTYKGLNSVIQGSAADMMKMGLVLGWEQDKRIPYLTVHDEVDGPVKDDDDAMRWKKTMETCVELCVPIKSDVSIGEHWK